MVTAEFGSTAGISRGRLYRGNQVG